MANPKLTILGGAQYLLNAADFASKDKAKGALQGVYIRKLADSDTLSIVACNDHMLYRCEIPQAANGITWEMEGDSLLLPAVALKKPCPKANQVIVADTTITLLKGGVPVDMRPIADAVREPYPMVDQLIPDKFTYESSGSIRFNSEYLEKASKVMTRLSEGFVTHLRFNRNTTPVVLAGRCQNVLLEVLVMPLYVNGRTPESNPLDYPPYKGEDEGEGEAAA